MKLLKRLISFLFSQSEYHLGTSSRPRPFPLEPVKPMTDKEMKEWINKMRGKG